MGQPAWFFASTDAAFYSCGVARIRLGDLLVQARLIDEVQLQSALAHQRQWGGKLGDVLVLNDFLDEMMLWRGLSKQLGVELVSLPDHTFVPGIERQLPFDLCQRHHVVPLARDDKGLTLATSDPNNLAGIDEIAFRAGTRLRLKLAPEREIEWALRRLYHGEVSPCPPPRVRRVVSPAPPPPLAAAPIQVMHLGNDTHTPLSELAAMTARIAASSTAMSAAMSASASSAMAPAMPWWNEPTASDAEVAIRETAHLLRFIVEACVKRGLFSREDYLERFRSL